MKYYFIRSLTSIAAAAVFLTVANPAFSRGPDELSTIMKALLVQTDAYGNEVLVESTEAAPGDVVEYQITYTNLSEEVLTDFSVVGPVPDATHYIGQTAFAPGNAYLQVSIDGGQNWEFEPVTRLRKNIDGEIVEVVIPPEQYTDIRWQGGALASGQVANYEYRVAVK